MDHTDNIAASYVGSEFKAWELANPVWETARPVHITRYWSGEEAPESRHAEARILWSDESLNVRFVCNQRQPLVVSSDPKLDQKTIGLWDRDVCEIFLAPFPDQPDRYFEFEAAPTGEWVDLAVCFKNHKRENDFNFVSGMTVTSRVSANQVEILMRVPWTAIRTPKRGDEWRANLFRCVGLGNERYLAWRPTLTAEPNFHVPSAFGILRFT